MNACKNLHSSLLIGKSLLKRDFVNLKVVDDPCEEMIKMNLIADLWDVHIQKKILECAGQWSIGVCLKLLIWCNKQRAGATICCC